MLQTTYPKKCSKLHPVHCNEEKCYQLCTVLLKCTTQILLLTTAVKGNRVLFSSEALAVKCQQQPGL